jgi:hypothetical protein
MTRVHDRPVPVADIPGWGAAVKELQRVVDYDRRMLLATLTKDTGLQGAPALGYAAGMLRYLVDGGEFPAIPAGLHPPEGAHVNHRVRGLLQPFVDVGDQRLGTLRGGLKRETA